MTSGGKRRRQAAILEIVRKQRVPHEEAVRTGDPELSSRDGASVRATLSRGRANHNDVTPYDTNIRVMMFKVIMTLTSGRT